MDLGKTITKAYSYIKFAIEFIRFAIYSAYTYAELFYKIIFPSRLKHLNGEVVLVTGAGSGIGKHTCLQLARSTLDIKIICLDQNKFDNDLTVKELRSLGSKAFGYEVDISQHSQIERVASQIKKEIGDVTIVVNNAGMMPLGDFFSQSADSLERTFEVNVLSHFWILKQFVPKMIENRHGHIVTICSFGGIMSKDNAVGYCGSKFAVNGYLESLKDEISNHPEKPDINFTTVYPFFVRTGLSHGVNCTPRFPSLTPILEPEFVAQEIVDGIRRNAEYVYCPSSLRLFTFIAAITPRKMQRAVQQYFQLNFEPSDALSWGNEKKEFALSD